MTTASALYEGTVRHRRLDGHPREFVHRIAFAYLDLDELPGLLGGRLVRRAPGVVRVRRRDLFGAEGGLPVADAVRARVAAESDPARPAPTGPVRVLTQPRILGHCFNPVSFYYCFTEDERLDAVVAEVTNTPWGERASYVLRRDGDGAVLGGEHAKALHVSPFQDMLQRYVWQAAGPGPTLSVHIENRAATGPVFDATLALERRPLDRASLARSVARHPAGSLRVLALIYGHAVALKLRGVAVHAHPRTTPSHP